MKIPTAEILCPRLGPSRVLIHPLTVALTVRLPGQRDLNSSKLSTKSPDRCSMLFTGRIQRKNSSVSCAAEDLEIEVISQPTYTNT